MLEERPTHSTSTDSLRNPSSERAGGESFDMGERLSVLAGEANAAQARLVDALAEAIETEAWRGDGIRSVAHWLTIQLGVSYAQAHRLEETARRITEFPLIGERFRDGLLSHDQVNAVVTAAPAWADVHAYELIQFATVPQIRRIIRTQFPHWSATDGTPDQAADSSAAVDGPDGVCESDNDGQRGGGAEPAETETSAASAASGEPDADSPFRSRFSYGWTADGRLTGSFDLPAHLGMTLDAALAEARDALFQSGQHDATNVDALISLAQRGIDAAPSTRAERFKHYVHLDIGDVSAALAGDPNASLNCGTPIPPAVAKYLGCDSTMQPIWERDNTPIGAGRQTRTISIRLRRLITHRDGGCRVPGCGASIVEVHHIIHWLDGGVTETWNLVSLCPKHHRMHHDGRLGITGNPDTDQLVFTDRNGNELQLWPKPKAPPERGSPPVGHGTTKQNPRYRHPTGERLQLYWLGDWYPKTDYKFISRPDAEAWAFHEERSRPLRAS